jgi:hypothetical protein
MAILEWLYWRRFREPLFVALGKDRDGNLQAHKRVRRVKDEFWRLLHRQGPAIKPFKGNTEHSELMELGLSLGLNKLTDEELVDCFDEVCQCGKDHDANALKKQRARLRRVLETARQARWLAIPPRQRFEVYGADGMTAKAYHWQAKGIRHVEVSERGKRSECVIYPDGTALIAKTSRFYGRNGLAHLVGTFGFKRPRELFRMFFPN